MSASEIENCLFLLQGFVIHGLRFGSRTFPRTFTTLSGKIKGRQLCLVRKRGENFVRFDKGEVTNH